MALPGPFLAGQKLTAGQLNDATQKTITSQEVAVGPAALVTTSAGVESNITQLALSPVDLVAGALYSWNVKLILQNNAGDNDEYFFNIRRDTALTGTIVSQWLIPRPLFSGNGYRFVSWDDWESTADESGVLFFCSVVRVAGGAGTLSVYGQTTATERTTVALRRVGYASELVVVT